MPVAWLPLAVLPLVAGLAMILLGARRARSESDLHRVGLRAVGTVTDLVTAAGPDGAEVTVPRVRFRTEGGRSVHAVPEAPPARPYPPGVPIEVRHDPRRPERFVAGPSAARLHRVAGWLLLTSGLLAVIAVVLLAR